MKDDLQEWFDHYHKENPKVYAAFKHMAEEIRHQGHKRYGAKTIMERLRWESSVRYKGWDFKLSNKVKDRCSARYARMMIEEDSWYENFFEIRKLTTIAQREKLGAAHKAPIKSTKPKKTLPKKFQPYSKDNPPPKAKAAFVGKTKSLF